MIRSFEIPTVMKHGPGAIHALADEARALGMQRPLLVTDPGIVKAGLLPRATAPFKAAAMDLVVFDQVAANPPIALVDAGAALYRSEKCDGLIGFGGGRSQEPAASVGAGAVDGRSAHRFAGSGPPR